MTDDLLEGNGQVLEDNRVRVERILLEMMRPDRVQPRRVLREQLHVAFHNNRGTPTQALRQLAQLVQVAARQRARPLSSVFELLSNMEHKPLMHRLIICIGYKNGEKSAIQPDLWSQPPVSAGVFKTMQLGWDHLPHVSKEKHGKCA